MKPLKASELKQLKNNYKNCIEYVVLYELIYTKYFNHDKKFQYFLTVLMLDWKKRKEILDREVVKEL